MGGGKIKKVSKEEQAVIKKTVKNALKVELERKHSFSSINETSISTPVFNQITSAITVGTADTSNRIGDRYKLLNIKLGFNFGLADATNIVRVLLFRWKPNTTPTSADVFEKNDLLGYLMGPIRSDSLKAKAIDVIGDWKITLNANQPNVYFHTKTHKLGWNVQALGGSATNTYDSLYLMHVSDSAAINHPTIQSVWQIYYTDA